VGGAAVVLAVSSGPGPLVEIPQGGRHLVADFHPVRELHPPAGRCVPSQKPPRSGLDLLDDFPADLSLGRLVGIPVPVLPRFENVPEGNVPRVVLAELAPVEENVVYAWTVDGRAAGRPITNRRTVGLSLDSLATLDPLDVVLGLDHPVAGHGQQDGIDTKAHDFVVEFRNGSCSVMMFILVFCWRYLTKKFFRRLAKCVLSYPK